MSHQCVGRRTPILCAYLYEVSTERSIFTVRRVYLTLKSALSPRAPRLRQAGGYRDLDYERIQRSTIIELAFLRTERKDGLLGRILPSLL